MATVSAQAPATAGLDDLRAILTSESRGAMARGTASAGLLLADFAAFAGGRRLVAAAFLILSGTALEGAGILLLVPLLQTLLEPSAQGAIAGPVPADWLPLGPAAQYALLFAGFAALMVVRGLVLVARDTALARLQQGFVESIKLGLFDRLAASPWKNVMAIERARLVQALGGDMVQVGVAVYAALQAAAAMLMLAAFCAFALVLAPGLSLLLFGILGVVGLAGGMLLRRAGAFGQALVGHDLQMVASAGRFLAGLKLAKAQDLHTGFIAAYGQASGAAVDNRVAFVRSMSASRQLAALIGAMGAAAAVVVAVATAEIAPAVLVAFIALLARTAAPVAQVQQGVQQIANALPRFAELRDLAGRLPAGRARATAKATATGPCALSLRSVTLVHRSGGGEARGGIHAADLDLAPGEFIGLSGPTGAGKSTLLDLLAGLESPDDGQVLVDGAELPQAELSAHRARLAYLGADPVLFGGTLRGNLAWAAPDAGDEAMWQALEVATATDLVGRLGGGLDSRIDEAGANLSAGERQQIAIARALLRRPSLLLLDEATCSLDAAGERRLLTNLAALEPRPTAVLVSHRTESFAFCDRVITLSEGQLE